MNFGCESCLENRNVASQIRSQHGVEGVALGPRAGLRGLDGVAGRGPQQRAPVLGLLPESLAPTAVVLRTVLLQLKPDSLALTAVVQWTAVRQGLSALQT